MDDIYLRTKRRFLIQFNIHIFLKKKDEEEKTHKNFVFLKKKVFFSFVFFI